MSNTSALVKYFPKDSAPVRRLVRHLIAQGCTLSIWDGEMWSVKRSASFAELIAELGQCEFQQLRARAQDGEILGSFVLVYNNDGFPISDYSGNDFAESAYKVAQG